MIIANHHRYTGRPGQTIPEITAWPQWVFGIATFSDVDGNQIDPLVALPEGIVVLANLPSMVYHVHGFAPCKISPLATVGTLTRFVTKSFKVTGLLIDGKVYSPELHLLQLPIGDLRLLHLDDIEELVSLSLEDIGKRLIHADATVRDLCNQISNDRYGGVAQVHIQDNGMLVPPHQRVVTLRGPLRHRMFPLRGGVKPLVAVEAALSDLLHSHGVPQEQLKQRVDSLVNTLGVELCTKCITSKTPWSSLKSEASARSIRLVLPLEREHQNAAKQTLPVDPLQVDDPWSKASSRQKGKMRKQQLSDLTPATVRVDGTFFHAEGETVPLVPLDTVMRGTPGLAVLQELEGRLPTLLSKSRSSGPAALLVLGATADDLGAKNNRCSAVIAPAWVKGHASALRGVLVQVGDVEIQATTKEVDAPSDSGNPTSVFMLHVYKDETEHWDALRNGPSAFLRRIGFSKAQLVAQVWASAFYAGPRKTSPDKAQYFHCFLRLPEVAAQEFLELSGTQGLYNVPRSADRTRDTKYKLVMVPGATLPEARNQLDKLDRPFGLVRTGRGYGLRVLATDFAEARHAVFPELAQSDESDAPGPRRFKLLGVPKHYERSAVKGLIKQLQWNAKVLKPQGHRAWVVSSATAPSVRAVQSGHETKVAMRPLSSWKTCHPRLRH